MARGYIRVGDMIYGAFRDTGVCAGTTEDVRVVFDEGDAALPPTEGREWIPYMAAPFDVRDMLDPCYHEEDARAS